MTQTDFKATEAWIGPRALPGGRYLPAPPKGLIIFAHGSGSSRFSPRNVFVARELVRRGFASLLFDLLDEEEAEDRRNVFDIPLLGARVGEAIDWAVTCEETRDIPIGLFGASTGAGAALVAAARAPAHVAAVVSRGGRPDLAGAMLERVRAPTLLIVGGADEQVIDLNRQALARLRCVARLDIVPGATHLFEEPGALELVVEAAGAWFLQHVPQAA
jgi:pimeloyl-ACP methyl ester carboxylesterase